MTQDELKSLLSYDSETGAFQWTKEHRSGIKADGSAGWLDNKGYRKIEIGGKAYSAHRLAWLYVHGRLPVHQIDHIDGNKANNAIANLREATNAQNKQNMKKARSDNKSGFLGVCWYKAVRKWRADIRVRGKNYYLGSYETPEAAHQKYLEAKRALHEYGTI